MEDLMIFSDWSSINQLKNSINPDLKVTSSLLVSHYDENKKDTCCCDTGNNAVKGYEITVYQRHNPENVIYRIRVEADSSPGNWSLSYDQAVEMLVGLGFNCKYIAPPYQEFLSEENKKYLSDLQSLGYTHVVRHFSQGVGKVYAYSADHMTDDFNMKNLPRYNYLEWVFLPLNQNILISGLLTGSPLEDISI